MKSDFFFLPNKTLFDFLLYENKRTLINPVLVGLEIVFLLYKTVIGKVYMCAINYRIDTENGQT